VVLSAPDADGRVRPFIRVGEVGFTQSPAPDRPRIFSDSTTGEYEHLAVTLGSKVSILALELEINPRNRVNGTIVATGSECLDISVDQSFGNCPSYIHKEIE